MKCALRSDEKAGELIRRELSGAREIRRQAAHPHRRTGGRSRPSTSAFIAQKTATFVLTRDGWLKRVRRSGHRQHPRPRGRGDDGARRIYQRSWCSSAAALAYVCRALDIRPRPATASRCRSQGSLDDGEVVVTALSLDPRVRPAAELNMLALTRSGCAAAVYPGGAQRGLYAQRLGCSHGSAMAMPCSACGRARGCAGHRRHCRRTHPDLPRRRSTDSRAPARGALHQAP